MILTLSSSFTCSLLSVKCPKSSIAPGYPIVNPFSSVPLAPGLYLPWFGFATQLPNSTPPSPIPEEIPPPSL
ncbi:hypothetical protein AX774_g6852 [Zancudomyces culisetae]|uniref:Uncharacterized protein n=1 Tax=Zancudomyces culisetae TaxID=1213189 RepID=A0A1R1PFI7_ZANCU|nr:hypothetical protein AX774_g6852 [Zancudomyces culisetae]|eukprot:OMH79731.1 hypothetical protein AX774_g6852 [Zancudomyces culisetae]